MATRKVRLVEGAILDRGGILHRPGSINIFYSLWESQKQGKTRESRKRHPSETNQAEERWCQNGTTIPQVLGNFQMLAH